MGWKADLIRRKFGGVKGRYRRMMGKAVGLAAWRSCWHLVLTTATTATTAQSLQAHCAAPRIALAAKSNPHIQIGSQRRLEKVSCTRSVQG